MDIDLADSFTAKFDVTRTPDFERNQGFCGFRGLKKSLASDPSKAHDKQLPNG